MSGIKITFKTVFYLFINPVSMINEPYEAILLKKNKKNDWFHKRFTFLAGFYFVNPV